MSYALQQFNTFFQIDIKNDHKIIKIVGHPQTGQVFILAGNFSERNPNPFGNLYITFTNDAKICDDKVVAYELIDDSIINDLNIDTRTGNMDLNMGQYGLLNIKKKLLTYVLKKLQIPGEECVPKNFNILTKYNDYSGVGPSTVSKFGGEIFPSSADIDTLVENIMKYHNTIINKILQDFQNDENMVYDKLNIKITQLNRCKQGVNPTYGSEGQVFPAARKIMPDENFEIFIKESISNWESKVYMIIYIK